jgi:ABC-type branched-subunit amino acid transport system ATPase component
MTQPLLEIDHVTAGYDGTPVIRELSLTVAEGEVVALLGANGAGKTTTLRVACGFLSPITGQVRYLGSAVAGTPPQVLVRQGMAHVPEGRGIFFDLTVAEHFRLVGGSGADLAETHSYFPALRELHDRRAGLLSGGEQQMLSLACAMARRPKLLLIDELSLGLAPVIVERILPMVRQYVDDTGAGVLLVEQHVHLALEVADRGYVISHGSIVLERDAAELRSNREHLVASYLGEAAPAVSVTAGASPERRANDSK